MGFDGKYGRVTTEHGNIPDDEPVIVFRGRDRIVPAMLRFYREMCESNGSPQRHLGLIDRSRSEIEAWQAQHPDKTRTPDSERSREWMGE